MSNKKMMNAIRMAMETFNDYMNTDYSPENVQVVLFTMENCIEVCTGFLEREIPERVSEKHYDKDYYAGIIGEAIVGKNRRAILLRTDTKETHDELLRVGLHEVSHIFCTEHEIQDGLFYDRYCNGYAESKIQDGYINAGYTIWREVIADVLASGMNPFFDRHKLKAVRDELQRLMQHIRFRDPQARVSMALLIVYVMMSEEAYCSEWKKLKARLRDYTELNPYYGILERAFVQLRQPSPWRIDVDFIEQLGAAYVAAMAYKNQ